MNRESGEDGEWSIALANVILSVVAGFVALKLGEIIAKAYRRSQMVRKGPAKNLQYMSMKQTSMRETCL